MTTETLDQARVEAFAGRMLDGLNGAAVALTASIGHQVGLFDTMAGLPPSSSRAIAEAAGLDERYVREWLGAMTAGGVVEYDPATATYRLPPEHAACVTSAAGGDNLANFAQLVPLLGAVEQEVVDCFRRGGGVPYASYTRFHRVMADLSAATFDTMLNDAIVPLVPRLPERLAAGIEVADIGCGSGHAVNLLAQAFPRSRFVGYDFSEEAITRAREEAGSLGLTNARFEVQDVATLEERDRFDLITAFDAIHDQAHPARVLSLIARALRPDGVFLMADVHASSRLEDNLEHPMGAFLYTISTMHCMTVSLSLGGDGLGTVWGEQTAKRMLADAGFNEVDVRRVTGDILNSYYIARKQASA